MSRIILLGAFVILVVLSMVLSQYWLRHISYGEAHRRRLGQVHQKHVSINSTFLEPFPRPLRPATAATPTLRLSMASTSRKAAARASPTSTSTTSPAETAPSTRIAPSASGALPRAAAQHHQDQHKSDSGQVHQSMEKGHEASCGNTRAEQKEPMISVLTGTTAKRHVFWKNIVNNFRQQSYPNKELIILGEFIPLKRARAGCCANGLACLPC